MLLFFLCVCTPRTSSVLRLHVYDHCYLLGTNSTRTPVYHLNVVHTVSPSFHWRHQCSVFRIFSQMCCITVPFFIWSAISSWCQTFSFFPPSCSFGIFFSSGFNGSRWSQCYLKYFFIFHKSQFTAFFNGRNQCPMLIFVLTFTRIHFFHFFHFVPNSSMQTRTPKPFGFQSFWCWSLINGI